MIIFQTIRRYVKRTAVMLSSLKARMNHYR